VQLCDNSGKEYQGCQLQRPSCAIQGVNLEIPAILGYAGAETVVLVLVLSFSERISLLPLPKPVYVHGGPPLPTQLAPLAPCSMIVERLATLGIVQMTLICNLLN